MLHPENRTSWSFWTTWSTGSLSQQTLSGPKGIAVTSQFFLCYKKTLYCLKVSPPIGAILSETNLSFSPVSLFFISSSFTLLAAFIHLTPFTWSPCCRCCRCVSSTLVSPSVQQLYSFPTCSCSSSPSDTYSPHRYSMNIPCVKPLVFRWQ